MNRYDVRMMIILYEGTVLDMIALSRAHNLLND